MGGVLKIACVAFAVRMALFGEQLINTIEQAQDAIQISRLRKFFFTIALVVWILFGGLVMLIAKLTHFTSLQYAFPIFFHGVVNRICGIHTEITGEPMSEVPTLFVSNHVTYMDIFVLGSVIRGPFIAKSEVADWPIFGSLAKLQNTLFVERRGSKAKEQVGVVQKHLAEKGNLIMFPEGTSTAGDYVARFRSSLFAAAEGVVIQPVSVAYTHYEGMPMTAAQREYYAWYLPDPVNAPGVNNTPFLQHFLRATGLGPSRVQITFHQPTKITESFTRKECAQACEDAVRAGLHRSLGINEATDAELAART